MWQIINTFLCAIIMVTGVLLFGRIVLAVLIEIGGLSFLTLISFVFAYLSVQNIEVKDI